MTPEEIRKIAKSPGFLKFLQSKGALEAWQNTPEATIEEGIEELSHQLDE